MLERKPRDPVLEALLRRRVQVYTWLEGPVKQANLAALNRMIEDQRQQRRDRAA
jgi:hypothetical protein